MSVFTCSRNKSSRGAAILTIQNVQGKTWCKAICGESDKIGLLHVVRYHE